MKGFKGINLCRIKYEHGSFGFSGYFLCTVLVVYFLCTQKNINYFQVQCPAKKIYAKPSVGISFANKNTLIQIPHCDKFFYQK